MKLSTKGRYGLRAMIDLAVYGRGEAVPLASVAERQHISVGYLEQLMAKLKKAGLIISTRGAMGGYQLSKKPDEISVGDILRALEGSLNAVECPGLSKEDGCQESDFCVTKYVWQKMNESITKTVDEMKLSELAEQNRRVQEKNQTKLIDETNEPCARSEKV
jgi:Rrf2 family iron-sulfur cluster assembly transcriptional regulator